ncbi:uncharacterized protein LOC135408202 [Pseudopipra pipra]|uniref:uncharacterized protein LOC135408202 n=1 Tax=Pseudopipra pipra TaxID=415032 RepID=UPI003139C6B1
MSQAAPSSCVSRQKSPGLRWLSVGVTHSGCPCPRDSPQSCLWHPLLKGGSCPEPAASSWRIQEDAAPVVWELVQEMEFQCYSLHGSWCSQKEPLCPQGENGASGQEEEKPRDSSLSPSQPLNCLPGNGGTGWTLDCSLCMCGSPLRNCRNSWCRLGRWIGRPSPSVPAQPLGPCPVVALPALQGKWEGPLQVLWVTLIAVGWSLESAQS